jgi:hypothetical protein
MLLKSLQKARLFPFLSLTALDRAAQNTKQQNLRLEIADTSTTSEFLECCTQRSTSLHTYVQMYWQSIPQLPSLHLE